MKRKIAVLWMAMVMLGVTACGNEADQAPDTSEQTVQEGARGAGGDYRRIYDRACDR